VPERITAQRSERWAGFASAGTAIGRGRPGARTNLGPAARVAVATLPFPGSVRLSSVLLEQPQLRGLLGLAVASYNLALPERRGSSGSAGGGLGRLAAVTKEARGASEVGDDGQEAHASAAARASFDIDAKGAPEQLGPGAIARAVHALRRQAAGLLIAGGRWVGRSCRRWLRHDEWPPFREGSVTYGWVGRGVFYSRFVGSLSADLGTAHVARLGESISRVPSLAHFSDASALYQYDLLARSAFTRLVLQNRRKFSSLVMLTWSAGATPSAMAFAAAVGDSVTLVTAASVFAKLLVAAVVERGGFDRHSRTRVPRALSALRPRLGKVSRTDGARPSGLKAPASRVAQGRCCCPT
jgi:hypothetical protein